MLGKCVGKGRTANVYEYGDTKVVKLFNKDTNKYWIENEYLINQIANEFDCPTPIVYDLIELDGRSGIVFQKLSGNTISELLQKNPVDASELGVRTADAHANVHFAKTDKLQDQTTEIEGRINSNNLLKDQDKQKIINYLKTLPVSSNLCHGDLHPENYLVDHEHCYIIDWTNAYSGHPASDIARTLLMLESPAGKEKIPEHLKLMASDIIFTFIKAFLNRYLEITDVTMEDVNAWKLPIYAARLCENIDCEREWLINIINIELRNI
jgi:uncharacterized protein (TIGR02172 family)